MRLVLRSAVELRILVSFPAATALWLPLPELLEVFRLLLVRRDDRDSDRRLVPWRLEVSSAVEVELSPISCPVEGRALRR